MNLAAILVIAAPSIEMSTGVKGVKPNSNIFFPFGYSITKKQARQTPTLWEGIIVKVWNGLVRRIRKDPLTHWRDKPANLQN
jgi:hypothetical protein